MFRRIIFIFFLLQIYCLLSAVKIGYALSGGGARGFAHIGILKVLEEEGIHPDYISGTSIGALVGGLYAMGYNAAQIESLFVNTDWTALFNDNWKRAELYIGQKRWAPYGNAFFRLDDFWRPQLPQSVIIGHRINLELFRIFYPACNIDNFDDLPIPFSCIATDLITGELTIFDHGSLMQGIRASMSIPSILQPFPLNNSLYIDGGVSQNLPSKEVSDMGAEYIIGFKANSDLRKKDNLNGIIQVLDQTINIGITNNLNEQLNYCNFIMEPDLIDFTAVNFNDVQDIIKAGEDYARQHIDELTENLRTLEPDKQKHDKPLPLQTPTCINFQKFVVQGNKNIHSSKVKEYLDLYTETDYSEEDIIRAFEQAWNSQLFDFIYPDITKQDNVCILNIFVQERERKYLAMNMSYNREHEFSAGAVLSLHNYMLKNSRLVAEIKLGGKNELNLDVVKNFGEAYGIYYRIFPYIQEQRIYFYQNHNKVTSARSLEYGLTSGIGIFAGKMFVIEGYGYSYKTSLYREVAVSDTLEKSIRVTGIGIKAYHESLDDYTFPLSGVKAQFKSSFADDDVFSDLDVNRYKFDCIGYKSITSKLSALAGLQIGSHFRNNNQQSYEPYYLGGLDNFAGYDYYEKSAPYYRLLQAGMVINPIRDLFITAKLQTLIFSDTDDWIDNNSSVFGGVLELGFRTYLLPFKLASAISEKGSMKYYIAIGYTGDIFHFSRH